MVQVFLSILSYVLCILVVLPLVRDNYWLFRTLEYPRFQKLILVLLFLSAWCGLFFAGQKVDHVAVLLLCICMIYLFLKIRPYTKLAKREVKNQARERKENQVRIFTANVLQTNTDYSGLLREIRKHGPDIILLLETNGKWSQALNVLKDDYAYTIEQPQENTYGLLFYSKLELGQSEIKYLVKPDIPSLEAVIRLRSGRPVKIFGLHPEPPVPGESLRSTAKDKELMKIAFKAKECKMPCIVLGDLNDVAWSYTTSLFTKVSELLDVRIGRGFYSTFSAKSWFIRFPLDYIFCSPDFSLAYMKRLPAHGSDHFPIFTILQFEPEAGSRTDNKAGSSEMHEARRMTEKSVSAQGPE